MLPPCRLLGLPLAALALAVAGLPGGWSAEASTAAGASAGASAGEVEGEPLLPHPAHGQRAIALLGDQLDEAAELNGWTRGQLRDVLATDATAWVDGTGRVYFVDPAAPGPADSDREPQAAAAAPLGDTFLLHSKPDSNLTLLIDFDGATVSGTLWNEPPPTGKGVPNGGYPAWTLDADATTFSATERTAIQSVWQRVAEDYAPFDIDVTTQDPGAAGIERETLSDTVYGARALVTPSSPAQTAICGGPTCGGVAYTNVFGELGSTYQPAWIFPQSLSNDTKSIAEAVSHEVGHNFGLRHDGRTAPAEAYYEGHAMWAPIMGGGYTRPVTQWSKGEYTSADNSGQDDLALIAAKAPYRGDEAGGTVGTAMSGLPAVGYIGTAADTDTFLLGMCSGVVTLSATGAAPSPNLDLRLELLTLTGTALATSNPASAFVNRDTATGLSASITTSVAAAALYARVDGVGNGTGATGYSDYGSIGAYAVSVTGCTAVPGAPGAPTNLRVTPDASGTAATLSWSAPASDGGSAVTGYRLTRTGGTPVDVGVVGSHTLTGLTPGTTYTFTVAAVNLIGRGAQANASATLPVPGPTAASPPTAPTAPGAPGIGKARSGKAGGKTTAKIAWKAPTGSGGSALTGYRVLVFKKGGTPVKTFTVAAGQTSYQAKLKRGKYRFAVVALNGVGAGARSAISRRVTAQ